jgi:PleD family two-component response regulator
MMEIRRIDQSPTSILVVDRDPLMLTAMASVLDMQGHRALLARTEEVAMKAIDSNELDLIVLAIDDLSSGCEFAQRLRSHDKTRDVPVIFLVPQLTAEWSSRLHAHGGVYSLLQPIDPHALIDLVERAIWMPHVAKAKIGAPAAHLSRAKDWVRL